MTDDRQEFAANRDAGLRARHETREARAIRRQVAEEISAAITAHRDADVSTREFRFGLSVAAKIARDIGTQETS
jgi:hypothetical protein